jgi:hypothetical protein
VNGVSSSKVRNLGRVNLAFGAAFGADFGADFGAEDALAFGFGPLPSFSLSSDMQTRTRESVLTRVKDKHKNKPVKLAAFVLVVGLSDGRQAGPTRGSGRGTGGANPLFQHG